MVVLRKYNKDYPDYARKLLRFMILIKMSTLQKKQILETKNEKIPSFLLLLFVLISCKDEDDNVVTPQV